MIPLDGKEDFRELIINGGNLDVAESNSSILHRGLLNVLWKKSLFFGNQSVKYVPDICAEDVRSQFGISYFQKITPTSLR